MSLPPFENQAKNIKRDIYGKPQKLKLTFPAGFGEAALFEAQAILENLWFKQKWTSELTLQKNSILIKNIHMSAAVELLMRSQCITDLQLIIFEGKVAAIKALKEKCQKVRWDYYLDPSMSLKIKVNSIASKIFHETLIKDIIKDVVLGHVSDILAGEDTFETTCVSAYLYEDRLTLSISLAGSPLYKRGYRGQLSASAPLREDYAACLIKKALEFGEKSFDLKNVLIPFSGTGTFAFEFLQHYFKFSPILFNRPYALESMPLFRKETFKFLLKQAKTKTLFKKEPSTLKIFCMDISKPANEALQYNLERFKESVRLAGLAFPEKMIAISEANLFTQSLPAMLQSSSFSGDVLIALNPPYGLRLNKQRDTVSFYKQLAVKINEFASEINSTQHNLLGFVLCPDEKTWSVFIKTLNCFKNETYHFSQGGKDIRVTQFYFKNS